MMKSDEIQKMWEDPKNWKYLGAGYFCPDDPRVVVPKRNMFGWTVNFGHPRKAWLNIIYSVFITPLAAVGLYFLITFLIGSSHPNIFAAVSALILSITLICLSAKNQSDPKRFDT
jgi:hypothetical protein